jgi:hypothetical protein
MLSMDKSIDMRRNELKDNVKNSFIKESFLFTWRVGKNPGEDSNFKDFTLRKNILSLRENLKAMYNNI